VSEKVSNYGTFRDWLRANYACESGMAYVGHQDPQQAWNTCQEPTWMLWLADHLATRRLITSRVYHKIHAIVLQTETSDAERCNKIRACLWRLPVFFCGDFLSRRETALLVRTLKAHRRARRR
jgi:hypothetical protein